MKAATTDRSEAYAMSSLETVENLRDASAMTTEKRAVIKGPDPTRPAARHSARDGLSNQMVIESLSDSIFEDEASRSLEETNDMSVDDVRRRKSVISAAVRRSLKSENELAEEPEDKQEDPLPSVSLGAQRSAADNDEAVTLQAGSAVTEPETDSLHDTGQTLPTPDLETITLNRTISTGSVDMVIGTTTPLAGEDDPESSVSGKGSSGTVPPRANPPPASPKPPAPSLSRRAPLPINAVGKRPRQPRSSSSHKKKTNRRIMRRVRRLAKRKAKRIAKLVPSPK